MDIDLFFKKKQQNKTKNKWIHSIHNWTTATRHEVNKKKKYKEIKAYKNVV